MRSATATARFSGSASQRIEGGKTSARRQQPHEQKKGKNLFEKTSARNFLGGGDFLMVDRQTHDFEHALGVSCKRMGEAKELIGTRFVWQLGTRWAAGVSAARLLQGLPIKKKGNLQKKKRAKGPRE